MSKKKCTQHDCSKEAMGRAWFDEKGKWYPYCRTHLEGWKKLGCPIKLFSNTDILLDFADNRSCASK